MSPSETDAALRALLRPGETWDTLAGRLGTTTLQLSTARRLGISDAILARWVGLASIRPKAPKAPKASTTIGPPRGRPRVLFPIDISEIRADGERVKDLAHRISVHPDDIRAAIHFGLRPSTWEEWKGRSAMSPYVPPPLPPPPPPRLPVVIPPYRPNPTNARARALCREVTARRLEAESGVVHPHDPGIPTGVLPAWATRLLATDPTIQDPPPTPRWHGSLRSQLHRGARALWHAWPTP